MCLASVCLRLFFFFLPAEVCSSTTFLPVNKVCTLSIGLDLNNPHQTAVLKHVYYIHIYVIASQFGPEAAFYSTSPLSEA